MTNSELFKLYHQLTQSMALVCEAIANKDIDWRHLVEHGLIVEAIKALRRKQPNLGIKEAKEIVDAFRAM